MKAQRGVQLVPVLVIAAVIVMPSAGANPFKDHAVFSKLIGKWSAEGSLANQEGEEMKLEETWTGTIEADGTLLMKGERDFNEEKLEFTWRYSYNASTELFECEYNQTGMEEPLRLQATVADTLRTIELKTQLGDSGGELVVVNKISEDGKSIEGEVKISNADGQVALGGKIEHKKEE